MTQDDHVKEDLGFQPETVTDKVVVPGIQNLHDQSTVEVAEVIANVLRSRPNITKLTYVVGSHFEITSKT
jgi:hypothetical protein